MRRPIDNLPVQHILYHIILVLIIFFIPRFLFSQNTLQINEFLAINNTVLSDEHDEFDDWIELLNSGDTAVDIGGYYITDDHSEPQKWQIPDSLSIATTIPAHGYLILWADSSPEQGILHLGFNLSGDGEELGLYDAETTLVDSLTFPQQKPDSSYGRGEENRDVWQYFPVPTPGAANNRSLASPMPDVNYPGGFYLYTITLELSVDSADTEIYYTLDGSEPSRDPKYRYSEPVRILETEVLRTRSYRGENSYSGIRTETYILNEDFHLPVFSLTTDPPNLWGSSGIYDNQYEDWEKPVHIEYFETDGSLEFSADAGIKIHGPGGVEQKSLRLYARSRYGTETFRHKFFDEIDVDEFKRLVLRNGGNDCTNLGRNQTMLRDGIVHNLYRQRNPNYPMSAFKPVHVYLNGSYWGMYNLRERQDRFYMESHYGYEDIDFLEYAAEEGEDNQRRNAIEGSWEDFEALIDFAQNNDLSIQSNYDYVESQVDIANVCEYWIFETIVCNYDWPFNNMKFFRPRVPGGKWQWVLWDTEFSLAHIWTGSYQWECLARSLSTDPNEDYYEMYQWIAHHRFVPELFKNADFRTIFINRYYDCLNTTLSTDNVIAMIDSLADHIRPDIEKQLQRWGGRLSQWNDALDYIRTFARRRPDIAVEHLRDYFDLERPYLLTVDVQPAGVGRIQINTVSPLQYPWSGRYSPGVPVTLTAKPDSGYVFVGWREFPSSDSLTVHLTASANAHVTAVFAEETTAVANNDSSEVFPCDFALKQNYPNPFNPMTTIEYTVPKTCYVEIEILDVLGRSVCTLISGERPAGDHKVTWNGLDKNGSRVTSGVYFYSMTTGGFSEKRKFLLLR